ncbi:alpha/beta hydrolase [Aquabacterium sp. A3]|uniref:alpha/beta fold hydrolase n=1 Tax=Aquabacterium sp. A3 TaxID=3132829 RepID=UPI003119F16A
MMAEIALFVHSTGTGPFMWNRLLAQRPEGLTPLTPTNRGYSLADAVPRGQPVSLADEVAHLRAQIPPGTAAVHLGGHSYGGLAALTLALDPTLPVRSVWLYEPVLFGALRADLSSLPADAAADVRHLFEGEHPMLDDETGGLALWLERFVDYWNQPGAWAAMSDKARQMAQFVGWKMYQEVRAVSITAEPFDHYRLSVPLTLVRGERSPAPTREMVQRLAAVNPQAQVEVLSGLGHMSLMSHPEQVLPTLQRHWRRAMA